MPARRLEDRSPSRRTASTRSTTHVDMAMTASELWICELGARRVPRGARAAGARAGGAPGGARSPTRCCCSSTRPSTRAGAARCRASCRSARTCTARRGSTSSTSTAAASSPTTGPASSSAIRSCGSSTSSPTCARSSARSSPRSPTTGIQARARPDDGPDYTGVWTEERKIASIGVHVARGVTTHGFAVNVDNDLAAVRLGRRLRAGRRAHDVGARGDRARRARAPLRRRAAQSRLAEAHPAQAEARPRARAGRRAASPVAAQSPRRSTPSATVALTAWTRRWSPREPARRGRARARRRPRAIAATPSPARCASTASTPSRTTGTGRTRCAGAAARTSAIARSGCCSSAGPQLLGEARSLLHFSPEWCLRRRLRARRACATSPPTSTPRASTCELDVTALDLPDDAFDAVALLARARARRRRRGRDARAAPGHGARRLLPRHGPARARPRARPTRTPRSPSPTTASARSCSTTTCACTRRTSPAACARAGFAVEVVDMVAELGARGAARYRPASPPISASCAAPDPPPRLRTVPAQPRCRCFIGGVANILRLRRDCGDVLLTAESVAVAFAQDRVEQRLVGVCVSA